MFPYHRAHFLERSMFDGLGPMRPGDTHNEEDTMGGTVDFVFMIDGTGSMGACMAALKANIEVFVDELTSAQSPVRNWRGKVVTYRDVEVDGSRWYDDNPFVDNVAGLKAQLAPLEPFGGGDEPESLLDALHKLCKMEQNDKSSQSIDPAKWRYRSQAARVVIVFTDATYKSPMSYPDGKGGTVDDVIATIASNKIILILYAPDHECYDALDQVDKGEWEPIPGPDFVAGLAEYTGNTANFQKALLALAKSVSKSVETPTL